mgnify:CR=1 FL=1
MEMADLPRWTWIRGLRIGCRIACLNPDESVVAGFQRRRSHVARFKPNLPDGETTLSGLDRRSGFAPALIALGLAAALSSACEKTNPTLGLVQVFKTATCSCCSKWIEHLESAGFRIEATNFAHLASIQSDQGVPQDLQSCHTALVDGYVIEGHVPATDIRRLLSARPAVTGIAVPGMPIGSPGMEHSDVSLHESYDVMSFGETGVRVFDSHRAL